MMTVQEVRRPPLPYSPNDYLSGRVGVPPWFRYRQQRFYCYAFQNILSTSTAASNEITLDGDSFFLLEGINIISNTGDPTLDDALTINVQFSDTSKGQPWSTGNLTFRNVAGRGDNAKYLAVPTLLRPSTSVVFTVNNTTEQPIYGTLIGRKVYGLTEKEARFMLRRMWFQYDVFFGPLAPSQTDSFQVLTYADSDFYLHQLYSSQSIEFSNSELANGTNPSELMVLLRDITANKNVMNQQTSARLITGSTLPILDGNSTQSKYTLGSGFALTIPLLVRRNSTLLLEVTNQNASTATGTSPFNFTMEGCRVFD